MLDIILALVLGICLALAIVYVLSTKNRNGFLIAVNSLCGSIIYLLISAFGGNIDVSNAVIVGALGVVGCIIVSLF